MLTMNKNCLLLLMLLKTLFLNGQTTISPQSLIYQITTEEYIELEKGAILTENYLHTLVDSTLNPEQLKLGLGYYVLAYPQQEQLKLEVLANTAISAMLRVTKRDLMLEVVDSMGQTIPNAAVFFKNKSIPFDKKTKTYRLKKWKEQEGRILVRANQEAIFYELKKEGNRYRGYGKRFVYRLKAPIRLVRKAWWYVKEGIEYGDWLPYHEKKYNGYIALNQPKYRPNDTLKIKGYFTNKKGKPLNRPLKFSIHNNGKNRFSKLVSPIEKGGYLLELPLVDSLNFTVDKPGSIFVYDERKWNDYRVKSHRFDYEDYQLEEVDYSLIANKKVYEYGEKVLLKATGKFKTGEFIPDGTIRLKLRTKYAQNSQLNNDYFFDKKVILKDVLWETTLALSNNQATQILVPDSIFPKVALPIYAEAVFTNSNGEIQYKNVKFTITKPVRPPPLLLNLEGAFISAKVATNIPEKHPIIEWFVYKKSGQATGTKQVQLPYKERVKGPVYGYDISYPDSNYLVHLFLKDSLDLINVNGKHRGNKINIACQNPRRLAITFQLFKGKALVESWQSDQSLIKVNRNAVSHKNYLLKYQYTWGGQVFEKEEWFIYLKKELQITIDQPPTIIPGEEVAIKIKVKDSKKRAIKGVNLTAGAINGQFNSTNHFTPLNIPYKVSKNPKIFHQVSLESGDKFPQNKLPITKQWAQKTKVDSLLFYKLRFPESGVYVQYDTIQKTGAHQNIAQFAPYLIKNGQAEPIYMIYCNKKLVYYYDVDDAPPYAFIGQEGYNSIQLRSVNYTYKIDSVFLKKGQKLEFSIDVHNFPKHNTKLKIRKFPTSPLMTPLEKKIISQSIFVLRPTIGQQHLFQDSSNVHIFNRSHWSNQVLKVGPFLPKKTLSYVLTDRFKNDFYFEPHFSYSLQKNRERLYAYSFLKNKKFFPKRIPLKLPKQVVYTAEDIIEKTQKDTNNIIYHSLNRNLLQPNGQVQFRLKAALKDSLLTILWQPQGLSPYTLKPHFRKLQDWAGKLYNWSKMNCYFWI